jgi:tRNA(Ile)-lysidine synthase
MRGAVSVKDIGSITPISADEFAAFLARFGVADNEPLAIAVSGGPDSMALAWCARTYQNIIAFIVDHQLRPEATQEAEATQQRLAMIGIKSEILRWDHPPVTSRLHITARKARYDFLIEACHRHTISTLLFAHQQEDQAETVLMRLAKGSGVDGLAGIPADSMLEGVRIVRPFLNIPKLRLIATCRNVDISFIDDASNHSEKFTRGRLRKIMPLLKSEGLTIDRLTDLAARATEARSALDFYTHKFLTEFSTRDDYGVIRINRATLCDVPTETVRRAFTLALHDIHPTDYPPEYAALNRVLDDVRSEDDITPRTLHGALISATEKQITVMREVSAITDAVPAIPNTDTLWDQRWRVHVTTDNAVIRPLGNPSHEVLDTVAPTLRKQVPQGRARASLPALWRDDQLVGVPQAVLIREWPSK